MPAVIRPATRADFVAFYDVAPPVTVRALVAETSTGIVAFGGFYLNQGTAFVFTDHRAGMSRKDIVRGARALMTLVKDSSLPALAGGTLSHGDTALKHFGFRKVDDVLYQLKAS